MVPYLDCDIFKNNGRELYIPDSKHHEYPQLFGKVISSLSTIDLLINYGPDGEKYLEQG